MIYFIPILGIRRARAACLPFSGRSLCFPLLCAFNLYYYTSIHTKWMLLMSEDILRGWPRMLEMMSKTKASEPPWELGITGRICIFKPRCRNMSIYMFRVYIQFIHCDVIQTLNIECEERAKPSPNSQNRNDVKLRCNFQNFEFPVCCPVSVFWPFSAYEIWASTTNSHALSRVQLIADHVRKLGFELSSFKTP